MDNLIIALTELEKLKHVERGTNVGSRKESTAEHSWSCMLIADLLIDYAGEPLDRLKVMEYLLYHDIVEVYAGDAKFNDPAAMALKHQNEEAAFAQIKTFIPNPNRFERIISEYETRTSREAEFAKAVDCLDACVRNINDDTKSSNDGFTEALIRNKYLPHVSKFNITMELFETFITKLVELKKL
ncbi:MAG: HD domain-containing protein [Bacteroidetes bacterium]|jgi:putative hydrolase of HD superfamily|nr:HD domain-containing protein [Bacteroidota bacterium]